MSFLIKTKIGYVHGIDSEWMIITVCNEPSEAKMFSKKQNAEKFIDKYADTGMGLVREDISIIEIII
jgi:hypothetical protein